ncbi:MAG TPA: histidine phosphatase family protein [Mycobacteriales bacterium]|nr:histidine phosphatase family protein [Mycobacteriales bacterium]
MELVLVRHALPVRIDATPDGRPADPVLADVGEQQAGRLLEALRLDQVDALYSSPAARALETAAPLAEAMGLPLGIEPGIAEFDVNDPSYVPVEELRAANDPRWQALVRGDLMHAGVDPVAFRNRVVAGVEGIVSRHPGERVVLFTHSGTINAYCGHVLGQQRAMWFAPDYASLSRIGAARDGRRGVISLNETAHVRDLLPQA